jgi:hypothetical protein
VARSGRPLVLPSEGRQGVRLTSSRL